MAYNAEINVSVKNLNQVTDLEAKLSSISRNVNALNRGAGGGGRGGGGRRGGGGGSEPDPLKEEIASLKLQNTAITQANRGRRAQNKLKADGLDLEEAIQSLESIGSRESIKDLDAVRKEIELKKKVVIETERDLIKEKEKTAELVKQIEVKKKAASPTVVSHPALMGPHQATKGAGQAAMSIDTITKQSDKRLAVELKLRELEAQGVNTKKLRVKMGELVDAQNRRDFGTIKKINRELGRGISKEKGKLRVLKLQNQERAREDKEIRRTAPRQALNFDKRTGGLLRGPAGTSRNTLGNIGRRLAPKRGFDFGSALISGGFPLLFGQGPGVAAAGALGGGIGGMFGQMGGFAGGIAATAAVQSIQNAVNAVSQLGQALSPITPNIQALSQSLGLVGTQEQKRLELIEEVKGKQAAFNAAVDEMRRVIGDEATEKLREFGESTRLIGSEFSIAMTKMQSALAGLFGAVDRFLGLTRGAERSQRNRAIAGSDDPEIVRRREEIERLQNTTGGGRSGAKNRQDRIKTLKAELDELGKQEVVVNNIATRRQNLNLIESSAGKKLRQENELLQAKLDGNFEEVQLAQQLDAEIQKRLDKGMGIMEIDIEAISNAIELNNKLEKQVELSEKIGTNFEIIGESIASGVTDNITAAIQGTKSLGDAAKSILNDLSSSLIRLGVNTLLSKIPGFGGLPILGGRSKGGPVTKNGSFVVGEKGPELFVPKRSGTIIPNDKLAGGGSTNINVNIDASGSSVQGNEQQGKELGRVISAAIQSELIKQRRPGGLLR